MVVERKFCYSRSFSIRKMFSELKMFFTLKSHSYSLVVKKEICWHSICDFHAYVYHRNEHILNHPQKVISATFYDEFPLWSSASSAQLHAHNIRRKSYVNEYINRGLWLCQLCLYVKIWKTDSRHVSQEVKFK